MFEMKCYQNWYILNGRILTWDMKWEQDWNEIENGIKILIEWWDMVLTEMILNWNQWNDIEPTWNWIEIEVKYL